MSDEVLEIESEWPTYGFIDESMGRRKCLIALRHANTKRDFESNEIGST